MNRMHIRQIDLNLIAVFDAIMAEGSLGAAGRRLGMSPSAVSHALARLRSLAGDELFVRTGRGIRPTAHALAMASPLRTAVDLVQGAFGQRPSEDPPFPPDRSFAIDLPVGFDWVFVPSLLALADAFGFAGLFQVHSRRAADLLTDLRYGETELALDLEASWPKGLVCEPLYEDDFVVCARRGHPALAEGLGHDRYVDADHVTLTWARGTEASPVDERLGQIGIRRTVRAAMPTLAGCASIVEGSDLLFTFHRRIANILAARFDLEVAPLPFAIAPVTLHQIWHERHADDPGHRWLRSALAQIARSL
jgi:DNA-binding transcriptional LysR family regulator